MSVDLSHPARAGTKWPVRLRLDDPCVEYLGEPATRGRSRRATGWRREDASEWRWEDGACAIAVRMMAREPHCGGAMHVELRPLRPVRLRQATVDIRIACEGVVMCADHTLRWGPLAREASLNGLTPLVVRFRAGRAPIELRSMRGGVSARLTRERRALRLRLTLDAAALHPRWSFEGGRQESIAAAEWNTEHRLSTVLCFRALDGDLPAHAPAMAARLPRGAEAAFTITDHCDFDSVDRLRTFLHGGAKGVHGWLGRGLRLTKGVFALPSTPPAPRIPVPSLVCTEYAALVQELHRDGSEIAPHGVNESGNVPPAVFRDALAGMAGAFHPRTWIDHGTTLHYAYSMGGAGREYDLLGELRRHGMTTLWSYNDVPVAASGSLNMLAPDRRDGAVTARRVAHHILAGAPLVAAHYLRSHLRSRIDGRMGESLFRAMSAARHAYMHHALGSGRGSLVALAAAVATLGNLRRLTADAAGGLRPEYTRSEELAAVGVVYPERALPLPQAAGDDLLMFSTMEVLHTRDAFTPEALERLYDERGVHVAHCYLLNVLPYVAGVFRNDGAESGTLSREWMDTMELLEHAVRSGAVWNPPVGELAEWMRAWEHVSVVPGGISQATVRNLLHEPVEDFTILLPAATPAQDVRWGESAPAGYRRWSDWLAVWGHLPANGSVEVRWS